MKAQLWVDAHDPVPLVPLSMLRYDAGDTVYLGKVVLKYDSGESVYPDAIPPGWYLHGGGGLMFSLEQGRYFWDCGVDLEKSMGRRLQDGESLLVRYTSR